MSPLKIPLLLGAVALTTGCASTGFRFDAGSLPVVPVQTMQPAGTAAGHYAVGRIDLASGRYDAAAQRFEQALRLDADMVDAYNALGIAHGLAGRYEKAVTVFDAAIAVAPDSAQIVGNLGYALLRAGRLDEATKWLDRARDLDPANARVQENLRLLARARLDGKREDEVPAVESAPVARQNDISVRPNASYELVTAGSNDGALLRLGPNVYEVRGSVSLASATGAAAPAVTPAMPLATSAGAHRTDTPVVGEEAVTAATLRRPSVSAAAPAAAVLTMPPVVSRVSSRQSPAFRTELSGLEVSNGVGTPHLAGGTARTYARYGWRAVRVSDYRYFGVSTTEIHYLEGHRDGALALRATLPVPARLVLAATLHRGINVQLVLGKDMVGRQVAAGPAVTSSADSPDLARPVGLFSATPSQAPEVGRG
jgi:hypothetical protein